MTNMLKIISENLNQNHIPFAVIGALALSLYGFPRYTSDTDILTESVYQSGMIRMMEKLGYTCCRKTASFAQFDSEFGVFGYIDFMFVNTEDGKNILKRSAVVKDELFGEIPVIQPSDYIILKLMAIANNPDRSIKDEQDISCLVKLYKNHLISEHFEPLDTDRIYRFADRFRQRKFMEKCFDTLPEKPDRKVFAL